MPPTKSIRRSVNMTPEMRDRLAQLVSKHPRDVSEAICAYLDEQTDLIGSRRHFQKSLQDRIDRTSTQPIGIAHSRSWKRGVLMRIGCSLISAINEGTWLENRILGLLRAHPEGTSVRETYRTLRAPRKAAIDALRALENDGTLVRVDTPNKPGPKSETYRLVQH